MDDYRAPAWLPGGNLQTIWGARVSRQSLPGSLPVAQFLRERWTTPDGDFIDVDHLVPAAGSPAPTRHLVMFHGLEGASSSHYALGFAAVAQARGWAFSVPHFRGCSGELNHAPRAYHSGDYEEVGWILQRLRERASAPLRVVGISLGGNALLRWAQEAGASASAVASAVAAVSSPIDLAAAGAAIDSGFNLKVYARMFLATMKPKAMAKWAQHPGLFDRERVQAARTIFEFDNAFTAPLHGYTGTPDYWARASARPHLAQLRIPTLLLHARNDPFVPIASIPQPAPPGTPGLGLATTLWQPAHGGHVGFPTGRFPGHVLTMPEAVADWLNDQG